MRVKTRGGATASTINTNATVALSAGTFSWDVGSQDIKVEFVDNDQVKVTALGTTSATINVGDATTINLNDTFGGAFAADPDLALELSRDKHPVFGDETGDVYNFRLEQYQTVSILRQGTGSFMTGITLTGATTTFNLSDADFVAGLGEDMGVDFQRSTKLAFQSVMHSK